MPEPRRESDSAKVRAWKLLEENGYAYLEAGDIVEWLDVAGLLASKEPPPSAPVTEGRETLDEWEQCEGLCNLPEIDEALRNFGADPTGDNAACLVRAIRRAVASVAAPAPEPVARETKEITPNRDGWRVCAGCPCTIECEASGCRFPSTASVGAAPATGGQT